MTMFEKFSSLKASGAKSDSQINDHLDTLSKHYKERLLKECDLNQLTKLSPLQLRLAIERKVTEMMADEKLIISHGDKSRLLALILNESVGYGPLEPLLKDDEVTEIMVNGPDEVYVEKNGKTYLTDTTFKDHDHIRHIIERIIAPIGRRIDESSPMVDARLRDGSRVNAVIPPVSLNGPVISIRKFNKDPFSMEDLIGFGSLTTEMAVFLQAAVKAKLNIVISGGTGSGKTTFLNVLSSAIPVNERIITIEDMAELRLNRSNVVRLEARPQNVEGTGEITIRQLVKNALRMRPDRIVVGEVRSGEALDMLQAMNTGHEGSLTTVHANNPRDCLSRIEAMVVMNNESLSVSVVRYYILSAIDLIVQTERMSDGTRKVVNIAEVHEDQDKPRIEPIFIFKRQGTLPDGTVVGYHTATGFVPACVERLKAFGQEIPLHVFQVKEGQNG